MSKELKFKVVFVGDSTVGKTSIIHKYLNLEEEIPSTVGATSTKIEIKVKDSTLSLSVWDTAGQETFRNLVPIYAKGAHAAVIVFDQSNPPTYEHVSEWYSYIQQQVGQIIVFIAQNKCDLNCAVNVSQVFSWAEENQIQVISTSAKVGTGIDSLFTILARSLYDSTMPPTDEVQVIQKEAVELEKTEKKKTGCC